MGEYPVHDRLTVERGTDIYRTDEWLKAVVQYHYESADDTTETAIYLWHRDDDGWTRKNKYVVKTLEAWADDRPVIDELLETVDDASPDPEVGDLPVSDYYSVCRARTVFKSDDWWKAIVHVDGKGGYETDEVVVYLWQRGDDGWRRQQKYAIKDPGEWRRERDLVSEFVDGTGGASAGDDTNASGETGESSDTNDTNESGGTEPPTGPGGTGIFTEIEEEFQAYREQHHVSETTT